MKRVESLVNGTHFDNQLILYALGLDPEAEIEEDRAYPIVVATVAADKRPVTGMCLGSSNTYI